MIIWKLQTTREMDTDNDVNLIVKVTGYLECYGVLAITTTKTGHIIIILLSEDT